MRQTAEDIQEKGSKYYIQAARLESVEAMRKLADYYRLKYCYGYGESRQYDDLSSSFLLYQKATILGDIESQYQVGHCYKQGIGTSKDIKKAEQWFIRAAEQGHEQAGKELKNIRQNQK